MNDNYPHGVFLLQSDFHVPYLAHGSDGEWNDNVNE